MKRDKRSIDEILRHYLPAASTDEVEAAGEAVLLRLQEEMEDRIEDFKYPEPEIRLRPYEQLMLAAVSLLRGEGHELNVLDTARELASRRISVIGCAVAMRRLRQQGLIETYMVTLPGQSGNAKVSRFRTTPRGERALAAAGVMVERCVPGYLQDLV
jgi:hypothetical protein